MTDAGPDQILSLAEPTSAEWDFSDIITNSTNVVYNLGNSQAKVFSYTMVVTFDATTINGDFKKDEYWRAESSTGSSVDVLGQVVAYDPVTRKIELSVDYAQSSDFLQIGDVIALWLSLIHI